MKAMIFAAGIGSRLKPWTDFHPKALVEIGGIPMLRRVIESLKNVGVDYIVINTHHFADQIESYVKLNNNFNINIQISSERDLLLDTGGGLLKAAPILQDDGPIILHNADIFTTVNLAQMLEDHRVSNADATLLVASRQSTRSFLFDNDLRLRGWKNLRDGNTLPPDMPDNINLTPLAFGGIHIINFKVLNHLNAYNPGKPFSITPFYALSSDNLYIKGFISPKPCQWFDVGRPENLHKAQEYVNSRQE